MMISELLFSPLLFLAVWILWKSIKRSVIVSDLDNIRGHPSDSFLQGHFHRLFGHTAAEFHKEVLATSGAVTIIKFPFGDKRLFISDPKALVHILMKDHHVYQPTTWFIATIGLVLGPGLFSTFGDKHRKQRKMLNPVFSMVHLRDMIPIFYGVAYQLRDAIASKVTAKSGRTEVDILPWLARTALELIGQSGFGYSFDSMTEDAVPHIYALSVKKIIPALTKLLLARVYVLPTLSRIGTRKFQRSLIDCLPGKALDDVRKLVDIINNTTIEILESKKKAFAAGEEALEGGIGHGKDLMSILLRANMQAEKEDKLTDEELLGQMSTFTFGATETTSSTLSRLLWLLSQHQDVQDKLRDEVCEARKIHGDCPYDVLSGLPYLDAVCRETLRLYPPIITIFRTAVIDTVLPLSTPITGKDGRKMSEILMPKGTDIVISTVAANTNPDIWGPDSHEWKPERWLQPFPDSLNNAHMPGVYANLAGTRACIGFKFTQLELSGAITVDRVIQSLALRYTDILEDSEYCITLHHGRHTGTTPETAAHL